MRYLLTRTIPYPLKAVIGTLLLLINLLSACDNSKSLNRLEFNKDGLLILNNWFMVGPFSYDTTKQNAFSTFGNKDLANFNIDESTLNPNDIKQLQDQGITTAFISSKFLTTQLKVLSDSIELRSNVYLTTTLFSDSEQDYYMMVDGAGAYSIWLNQELLYSEKHKKNASKLCDKFIKIKLKQGENVFSAKINRESNINAWGVFIALAEKEKAQEIYRANYYENFIVNPIVGDSIQIYSGPYKITSGKIINANDSVHKEAQIIEYKEGEIAFSTSNLKDGFYKILLNTDSHNLSQLFYKGDLQAAYRNFMSEQITNKDEASLSDEMISYKNRIEFLYDNYDNKGSSAVKYYNTNLVNWTYRLKCMVNGSIHEKSPIALKAFTQPEKSKTHEYLLHLPDNYRECSSIPLIIVAPYDIPCPKFSVSWFTANYELIHIDAKLASERGFAICYLYGNGPNYSPESFKEEFIAVMKHIASSYDNLNTNQVYITGDCLGATRALILASQVPNRIAAISLRSPLPHANYQNVRFNQISDIPVYLHHGIYDIQIPIVHMRDFKKQLLHELSNVQYTEHEIAHDSYRKDHRNYDFDFFREIHHLKTIN